MNSDERQAAWEEGREFLLNKIEKEGKEKFFKTPKTCATIFLLIVAVSLPIFGLIMYHYSPDHIRINITEKVVTEAFKAAGVQVQAPFRQIPWIEAMEKYVPGSKPSMTKLFNLAEEIIKSSIKHKENRSYS